jgi:hypothetical protein
VTHNLCKLCRFVLQLTAVAYSHTYCMPRGTKDGPGHHDDRGHVSGWPVWPCVHCHCARVKFKNLLCMLLLRCWVLCVLRAFGLPPVNPVCGLAEVPQPCGNA